MGWQGRKRGWKDFYSVAEYNKAHHDYYYRTYRDKFLKESSKRYHSNPNENKNWALKRKFGITLQDYINLLERQRHVCAICHLPDPIQSLAVDHCHNTGRVRGLLCGACNKGLGYFKDNTERLKRAIDYLS